MKILFLLNVYEPDGPGHLMLEITSRLAIERGFQCETVALSRGGVLRDAFEARGVRTTVLGSDGPKASVWKQAEDLRKFIAAGRFDAVHTNLLRADIIGRWAAARAGVRRIVSTEHGIHTWDERGPWREAWIARAYRYTARRAQTIVAVSRFVANALRAEGVPETKIQLIYNGVDTHRFRALATGERQAARRRLGVGDDETLILAAGKLAPLKGHALLIDAAKLMKDRWLEQKVRILIAGDGPERPALEDRLNLAQVRGLVGLVGHLGDSNATSAAPTLEAAMASVDLFVQPSLMESFGMAAVEAMACGVPVVATRVGGVPEIIDDGLQGLLCAPDAVALARRIDQALESRGEWAAWGEAGAQRARREFDLERVARQYGNLFG